MISCDKTTPYNMSKMFEYMCIKYCGSLLDFISYHIYMCGQSVIVPTWTQQAKIMGGKLIRLFKVDKAIGSIFNTNISCGNVCVCWEY